MTTATLDIRAWNCMVSNTPGNVTRALEAFAGADVIVLTEATGFHAEIAAFAQAHGYNVQHEKATHPKGLITEHGDTALLITKKAVRKAHGILAMRSTWVGPKHALAHEPRRYPWAQFALRGVTWHLVAAHWPTGYGTLLNPLPVAETMKQASGLLSIPGPTLIVGDLNVGTHALNKWAVPPATAVGTGRADNALMRDCTGTIRTLDHYGSDHPAVAYRFTTTVKEAPVTYPAPNPVYLGPPAHKTAGHNKPIHRIVIHSTVSACVPGGARSIAAYFRSQAAGGSAHYVVDPSEVVQAAYDDVICWHAPPNSNSIGIEMCDTPGPVPNDPPGTAARKAKRRKWRWILPNQRALLRRTARLTAELCLAYDVPVQFLTPADLAAGKHGITTHANVSQAWHQSTHWDPGFWPQARFIQLVQKYHDQITKGA